MHVVIVGSYGFANTGDEAILAAIVSLLRQHMPGIEVTVLSGDPEHTAQEHGVAAVHWRDISGMFRVVENADLVLCGGGGLFFDYWGCAPDTLWMPEHWGLSYVAGAPLLARLLGKPIVVYAVGVGPLRTPEGRALTRAVMKVASLISVRDAASQDLLAELGIPRDQVAVTADPAFAWTDPAFGDPRNNQPVVAVALRQWEVGVNPADWEMAVAGGLDRFLRETGGRAVFVPFQWMEGDRPENDVAVAQRVLERMSLRSGVEILPGSLPYKEKIRALAGCALILGMRLHALVFGIKTGTPFVALNYDPKIAQLTRRVGQEQALLDLRGLTADGVADHLALAWQDRHEIAHGLRRHAEDLTALALEDAHRATAVLLKRPNPGAVDTEDLRTVYGALQGRLQRLGSMKTTLPAGWRGLVNVLTPLFFDHDGTEMMGGGAERYLLELAPIIRSMGYDIRVYQSARGDWTRSYDGIEVAGLDTGGVDGRLNEAFHTRVGSEALTLYHAFYLAAPLCVPGSIGISHGVNWDKPEFQYPREGFLAAVEQFLNAISNLACVVSVDTNTINWVRATQSDLAGRLVYIPNFVDTEKFRPSETRRTPTGSVTVLYPRRLYAPRGFWTVADVLPDLLAEYPHLMFHFVGPANSPREEAAMRAFTEAYPGRVRWTVLPLERMPEAYQGADITVIPTLYAEGTSLSCLEALASGNAVIATNVGGLPNLIQDGYNGLLIDPTPQALRGALDRLIREPDLCRELARRGAEVAQHYRLDLWKERWRVLLEEHLSRPRVIASAEALEALGPPPAPLHTPLPGLPQFDLAWLEGCAVPQSMQFMIDCLPTIRELIQGWPRDRVLEVLDVRTGSGAGANLLATLHRSVFFGVQMKVDAMDISSAYKAYADVHFPDITYAVGNLFDLHPDRTWDLIICSHVIEHLNDPAPLISEISQRARHWAVFCAPFEEKNLLEGHSISITAKMIAGLRIQPLSMKVMTSPGWKHPVDEQSEVVVFVVGGRGLGQEGAAGG